MKSRKLAEICEGLAEEERTLRQVRREAIVVIDKKMRRKLAGIYRNLAKEEQALIELRRNINK